MNIDHIRQRLRSVGAKPAHQALVLRNWTRALPLDLGRSRPEDFFPREMCAPCPGSPRNGGLCAPAQPSTPARTAAGCCWRTRRRPGGGERAAAAGGLCVSTQVGCAVGCTFCMTGRDGLLRQLGSAEIVAQVALARRCGR
jgi:23S rRNA (adenine2503-C2)-methyltransferase